MTEHAAQPGLRERPAGGRAGKDHEALGRDQPGWPLHAQVGGQLGKERPVDRDHPLTAALAAHPQPAQPLVDVGKPQRADLPSPQAAQQHRQRDRPVAVGRKLGQERRRLPRLQRLRQPLRRSDQPSTATPTARTQMAEHATRLGSQPLTSPWRRDRVLGSGAKHNLVLKQRPHRRHPPVDRRRRRTSEPGQPHHVAAGWAPTLGLPGDPVEHIRRHDLGQAQLALDTETGKAQHVVGVGPHRRRRERPDPQMHKEQVRRRQVRPRPLKAPLRALALHPHRHHSLLYRPQCPPPTPTGVGPSGRPTRQDIL
jgi:hypothetical protein